MVRESVNIVGTHEYMKNKYGKPKMKLSKEERKRKKQDFLNSLTDEEYENYMLNMPIKPKERNQTIDHQNIAERLGWVFSEQTKTWKHPTYSKEFKSLVFNNGSEKRYVPYTDDDREDPKGIAFKYEIVAYPNRIRIYQNIWILEDLHTRKGRMREKFRRKMEEKKRFAVEIMVRKQKEKL